MERAELKKHIQNFPHRPGVYLFKDIKAHVLYVGKALRLKNRLENYTQKDILPKTNQLVEVATQVDYIETGGEFEALVLEANLIQKYRPKYNVVFRDDKSYLYVFISTGEEFPKIYVTRKPKTGYQRFPELNAQNSGNHGVKGVYFGPYPSSRTVREVLKMLRRIFPFCQQKKIGTRPCFYSHIGLCRPCPSYIVKQSPETQSALKKEYRRNVSSIKAILEGRLVSVTRELEKAMKQAARLERFEEATFFRDKLFRLKSLTESHQPIERFLDNPNFYFEESQMSCEELRIFLVSYFVTITLLHRIECFDVSHFQGNAAVGGQVVFIDGVPEKSEYRRYRMRSKGPNDVAQMREMVTRRLVHTEWEYPDLIVVDGGKPQVSEIHAVLTEKKLTIPLIGLAKRLEEIVILDKGTFHLLRLSRESRVLRLLQSIRDETHRFAITYHRNKRTLLT